MNRKIQLIAGILFLLSPALRADQSDWMAHQPRPVFEQGQTKGKAILSSPAVLSAANRRPGAVNPADAVFASNQAGLAAPISQRKPGKISAHLGFGDALVISDPEYWQGMLLLGLLAGGIGAGAGALLAGARGAIAGGVGGFAGIAGLPYLVAPAVLSAIAGGLIMNSWKGALMGGVPSLLAGLVMYALAIKAWSGGLGLI
ncbi:MAG: hypothetical protein HY401_03055 [Elusimicrobia bacterium]|nr:hypothetical protein [Elusimicrobiota bacterium]